MILLSHIVAGSVVSRAHLAPAVLIVLSLAVHYLLDTVPHTQAPTDEGYRPNRKTYFFITLDLVASGLYLWWFWARFGFSCVNFLVILASIFPDLIDVTRYQKWFYKTFRFYYDFHDRLQRETRKPIGSITQIVLIVSCIAFLVVTR